MGGRIWAESPAVKRRGARLLIALPLAKETRMSGPRILVVDDEPQILRFLEPALEASGYAR